MSVAIDQARQHRVLRQIDHPSPRRNLRGARRSDLLDLVAAYVDHFVVQDAALLDVDKPARANDR
jgi:hypothetical protein